jgi:2'-5' RNA ligase
MEFIRAFIAVDLGREIKQQLEDMQRKLKKWHANIRWVRPRNMHLTLAFLGNIPVDIVPPLSAALDTAFDGIKPLEIEAACTGTFGPKKQPRVLWVGISESAALTQLRDCAVKAVLEAGIEYEAKKYTPHPTLGRVKGWDKHIDTTLAKLEEYQEATFGTNRIDSVELYQSELKPTGAEYTVLHQIALK